MSGATLLRVPSALPNDPPNILPNRFRPPVLHPFRHLDRRCAGGNASRFEAPPRHPEALAELEPRGRPNQPPSPNEERLDRVVGSVSLVNFWEFWRRRGGASGLL